MKVNQLDDYAKEISRGSTVVFQHWVTRDRQATKVFRSSQPYYNGKTDEMQKFDTRALLILREYNIKCIVSLNEFGLQEGADVALKREGVAYVSIPVVDGDAPTVSQLEIGCDAIETALEKGVRALVYCGFGQGRTGTMMAAYALYSLPKKSTKAEYQEIVDASTVEEGSQSAVLLEFHKKLFPGLYG